MPDWYQLHLPSIDFSSLQITCPQCGARYVINREVALRFRALAEEGNNDKLPAPDWPLPTYRCRRCQCIFDLSGKKWQWSLEHIGKSR